MLLVAGWYDELMVPVECAIGISIGSNFALRYITPVIYGDPAAIGRVDKNFQVALLRCTIPNALKLPERRLGKAAAGKEYNGQYER